MPIHADNNGGLRCRYAFSIAGATCRLTTNAPTLGDMLCNSTAQRIEASGPVFTMEILVQDRDCEAGPPHFRGMQHIAVASFGIANVFVFDLRRRHVAAQISHSAAMDSQFWNQKILPIAIGVMGASIGVLPMHAACLAVDGHGLLVAGPSGAGKSTLSVALAQNGFDYLSDDWTYISSINRRISANGTSAPVKLLPDASRHFDALLGKPVGRSMNGELAYEVDAASSFGVGVVRTCEPKWLVFLQRFSGHGSEFTPMHASATRRYLETSVERLPASLVEARASRAALIDRVSGLPCWSFRYAGSPQYAALQLREFVQRRQQEVLV